MKNLPFATWNKTIAIIYLLMLFAYSVNTSAKSIEWIYTVRPGDSLASIVNRYLKDDVYLDLIAKYNGLDDECLLTPGERLKIPYNWIKLNPTKVIATNISGLVYKVMSSDELDLDGSINEIIDDEFQLLENGDGLSLGDRLVTMKNSSLILEFADGSKVEVKEKSDILFDTLTTYGPEGMVDSKILLKSGKIRIKANPKKRKYGIYRFDVETPSAISAVRGTEFRLGYEGESKTTYVELFEGLNDVSSKNASLDKVILKPGYGSFVKDNAAPSQPVELLPAPDLSSIEDLKINYLYDQVEWEGNAHEKGYYVELSRQKDFRQIIWSTTTKLPTILTDFIDGDGDYYIRIASIDDNGITGHPAVERLIVNVYPKSPKIKQPSHLQIYDDDILIKWDVQKNHEAFKVQIATDEVFSNVVFNQIVQGDKVNFTPLLSGNYFLRIASQDTDGTYGSYNAPLKFIYYDKSELKETQLKDNTLNLPAQQQIKGYKIQIFSDEDGDNKIWEKTVKSSSEAKIPGYISGKVYYRFAIIDDSGYQGQFTELKTLQRDNFAWVKYFSPILLLILL